MIDFESLSGIFRPQSVAVIGASDRTGSVGQAVYANLKQGGFAGQIFAVNQGHDTIQGDPAWHSVDLLPVTPDLVIVCTPAETVPAIARTCGERGVRGLVVISAGFRESGDAGRQLELRTKEILREYPGLRLIGPNCLGVLAPHHQLNASFSPIMPKAGNLAVISQSGALCTAMLDWSTSRELGFSGFVSTGNMLDVATGDLIDYFAADPHTAAVVLYLESLPDPRHFVVAARACTRVKPVIALKSGRFAEVSHAAASHTGAMAGIDAVYDAAFRRAGVERVYSFDDLFECANLLAKYRSAAGPRLAVVTNAGGPGIMISDAWLAQRGQLARLSYDAIERLDRVLPHGWSHGNPVDLLGDAHANRYAAALSIVARDPGVDSIAVMLTPQAMTNPADVASVIADFKRDCSLPVVAVWMGGALVEAGRRILESSGIPVYGTPEQAASALSHLISTTTQTHNKICPSLSSPDAPTASQPRNVTNPSAGARIAKWGDRLSTHRGLLGELVAKELLADYQIPVVPTYVATSAKEAAALAAEAAYPVVLKILSPDISHKTDVGGVELNLADRDAVIAAYDRILRTVREHQPDARIEGVTVQQFITPSRGVELLLGATRDAVFGPVIMLGAGGITAELQHDISMQLPPLTECHVKSMLSELRLAPLLRGYRGRAGVDIEQLTRVIVSFSRLVEDRPELQAIEINPLLATSNRVVALDARVIVDAALVPTRRYDHLSVRPYPREWVRDDMANGKPVRIRPVRLDDEQLWRSWLQSHSDGWTTLRAFPYRACSLDFDREVLLIAEDTTSHRWLGVAFAQVHSDGQHIDSRIEVDPGQGSDTVHELLERQLQRVCNEWSEYTHVRN